MNRESNPGASRKLQLIVTVADQSLTLLQNDKALRQWPVSTSRHGLGTEEGSFKTPLGHFQVSEKHGADLPLGAVLKGRVPTGEIGQATDSRDLVQTRILWLDGVEEANRNTKARYIYIHGTNHEESIGRPASEGCVRMRNADVAELYALVPEGTPVEIREA